RSPPPASTRSSRSAGAPSRSTSMRWHSSPAGATVLDYAAPARIVCRRSRARVVGVREEASGDTGAAGSWPGRLGRLGAGAGGSLRRGLLGITPLSPGIRQVQVFGSSVLLILDAEITLVDAGSRGSLRQVKRALRLLGRSIREVRRIVLTHYHPD